MKTYRAENGRSLAGLPPRVGFSAALVVSTLLATCLPLAAQEPQATPPGVEELSDRLPSMIEKARNDVFPALVNIQLVTSRFFGGKEIKGQSVGSGTIISSEGHVLTNQHVTANGRRYRCTLADHQEIPAKLVGEDPLTDLAVLQLDLTKLAPGTGTLPTARFGDSSQLDVGDFVMAMGSPLALSRSVTLGIVSNVERVFAGGLMGSDPDDMRLSAGQRTGLFTRWIQHDALINPGNSGGPLINLRGEVIGVNELGGGTMGFAIPSNLAQRVYSDLVEHGEVPRSWIGVTCRPIDDTGFEHGVLVNSIVKGSPADRVGLQAGDLIVELDGQRVSVRLPEQLPVFLKKIAETPIGSTISLAFERADERHQLSIVTERLEQDRGDELEFRQWGMTATQVTPLVQREHRLDSDQGILVTGVRPGGVAAAATPAIFTGDHILAVDDDEIADLAQFVQRYEEIISADPPVEQVLVEFFRRGQRYLTLLAIDSDETRRRPRVLSKAWLGVAVQPVLKDLAQRLGLDSELGFRITRIYPGTQAEQTDLRVGDIITHIGDRELKPQRAADSGTFQREIRRREIGSEVDLKVIRGEERLTFPVTLSETLQQPDEAERAEDRNFELSIRSTTFFDRVDNRWDEGTQGVIVINVESAGWAGIGGVQPGDLILEIDGRAVTDPDAFREVMRAVAEDRPQRVVFKLLRGVRTRFQYVEPEWLPRRDEDQDS